MSKRGAEEIARRETKQSIGLEDFLKEIERITGLHICLYDAKGITRYSPQLRVPATRHWHRSAFCQYIKSHPQVMQRCMKEEYHRLQLASQKGSPLIHTCYAGITDLILPLRLGQRTIGALYLGQIHIQSPHSLQRKLRSLSENYNIPPAQLEKISEQVPRIPQTQLKQFLPLIYLVQSYIEQSEELALWQKHSVLLSELPPLRNEYNMADVPVPNLYNLYPYSKPIIEAIQIIQQAYWKPLDQSTVARRVGFSESHFSRRFRAECGQAFRRCLLDTRVTASTYLLKQTDFTIKEIALMIGYQNSSAFVRAFKEMIATTPDKFRRQQG